MKILRYTPELQKQLKCKIDAAPWMHVGIDKEGNYSVWVWDSRDVLSSGKVSSPDKIEGSPATDNKQPLKGETKVQFDMYVGGTIGRSGSAYNVTINSDKQLVENKVRRAFDRSDSERAKSSVVIKYESNLLNPSEYVFAAGMGLLPKTGIHKFLESNAKGIRQALSKTKAYDTAQNTGRGFRDNDEFVRKFVEPYHKTIDVARSASGAWNDKNS